MKTIRTTQRHPITYAEAERYLWHAIDWLRKKSYLYGRDSAAWRDVEQAGVLIFFAIREVQKAQTPKAAWVIEMPAPNNNVVPDRPTHEEEES